MLDVFLCFVLSVYSSVLDGQTTKNMLCVCMFSLNDDIVLLFTLLVSMRLLREHESLNLAMYIFYAVSSRWRNRFLLCA